jgi:hypothetical protein
MIHALIQRLHHEVIAVPIDNQSRQQIGFCENQPVSTRALNNQFAMPRRFRNSLAEEIQVNRNNSPREHPQRDLRRSAVVGNAQRLSTLIDHAHRTARERIALIQNIALEDPGVSGFKARCALAIYADGVERICCSRAIRSAVLGCVENIFAIAPAENGFMM